MVRPLWGTKQETAEKLRWRIERILDAARVENKRSGNNPAAWKGNLALVLHKPDESTRGHHAALPYKDAPTFIARLRDTDTIAARALEFLILTATRSGETRLAVFTEFDLDAALWTIPEPRTLSEADLEQIYETYLSPMRTTERIDKLGARVINEIDDVMALIADVLGMTAGFDDSLEERRRETWRCR